jgi:aldose 1-epimerase
MTLEVITLCDPTSGATASILPGLGMNCFSFRPVHDASAGQFNEVLWALPDFAGGNQRASRSGIPILFPFPGRLRGQTLVYEGREYKLNGYDDSHGNAIHGFVLNRAWQVVKQTESAVVARFHAAEIDPTLLDQWPADFELTVEYQLSARALTCDVTIHNPDQKPLPWGLGLHPYFRLPVDDAIGSNDCVITVPVAWRWPLVEMLPSGEREPAHDSPLARGIRFGDARFDDVFTNQPATDGMHRSTIAAPTVSGSSAATRRCITIEYSADYSETVVFTPQHREAVCVEPYSCAPNAYELQARGIPSGLRLLAPGESTKLRMTISV